MGTLGESENTAVSALAADLLVQAGLGTLLDLCPLPGGANNRVLRVEAEGGTALLKVYFRHPSDPRDRLTTEFSFIRFAWEHGICAAPRPLAQDPHRGAALYEFIVGRFLAPAEINDGALSQAARFYQMLNRSRGSAEAAALPNASEACWSLEEHLTCVDRRVRRLFLIEDESPLHKEVARFVREEVAETWAQVAERVRRQVSQLGLSVSDSLSPEDRRLSPSDFGFHNALRTPESTLRFIDFEYAGWDDPAKLICDFFCQPRLPAPLEWYDRFATAVLEDQAYPGIQRQRASLLLPAYRVKWCCILLNEFLPIDRDRRQFAHRVTADPEGQMAQLDKARRALHAVLETR